MNHLNNIELLSVILGTKREAEKALRAAHGSLFNLIHGRVGKPPQTGLFAGEGTTSYRASAMQKIEAARELVTRAALEDMGVRDALTSPDAVRTFLNCRLAGLEFEVFVVIFLDAQNRVIEAEEMFRGTLTQTSVYPREVVKRALYHNAAAVILAHNHPSGEPTPSRADEMLTGTLKSALSMVDVSVLDHFIIAGNRTLSFMERGLI